MKHRPYITAIAAALALTATSNAQSYHWDRTVRTSRIERIERIERGCDRSSYFDALAAAAQRRRLIQLQEEANRELRRQRVAIEEGTRRAAQEDFSRRVESDRERQDAELSAARRRLIDSLSR